MNIYYVYMYSDPSRQNEPFYIGEGKNRRDKSHLKNPDTRKNLPFYNRLAKMKRMNIAPTIVRTAENLTQDEAFDLEIELIAQYKRKQDGGPLLNITRGGRGFANPTTIKSNGEIRKAWNKGVAQTEKTKHKISLSVSGFKHTAEAKAKISTRSSGENNPSSKQWVLVDPTGASYGVSCLRTFCKEKSISESSLRWVKNQNRPVARGPSKGWSCSWRQPPV
jgi:hypothetical protein